MYWFLGFVVTFTLGGVAGMVHAVPAIDFQMHNSLFLVAHFHTMVIGGVVFGYFAGLTYWFPKIFGFTLHEELGKIAAWCWIIGFVGAFGPLYILGIMGATRRLDGYDASLGWQGLFIVAGIGLAIILLGVGVQVLQLVYSIWKRNDLRDSSGDPWDGRTLEWSVASPAPYYNFAVTPVVTGRDAYWEQKQAPTKQAKQRFEPFHLPRSTASGVVIAAFAMVAAFGIIWYIWWLTALCLIGLAVAIILRSMKEVTEYQVTKDMLTDSDRKKYA
jgi:cytochrome o ubiquinol oxidase subunit 1